MTSRPLILALVLAVSSPCLAPQSQAQSSPQSQAHTQSEAQAQTQAQSTSPSPAQNPNLNPKQRGALVFRDSGCNHCHSIRNVGGNKGPDLSGVGRTLKKDKIQQQITNGSAQMPAFRDILDDHEINDLVAYLHSCRDKRKR